MFDFVVLLVGLADAVNGWLVVFVSSTKDCMDLEGVCNESLGLNGSVGLCLGDAGRV